MALSSCTVGDGVASSLTLADRLLPVRRNSTLRGTLSSAAMLLLSTAACWKAVSLLVILYTLVEWGAFYCLRDR